jgi:hypothetical protein
MDSRSPRANRGAGLKGQGCYRPGAVSVRPKGHRRIHSLSISVWQVLVAPPLDRRGIGKWQVAVPHGPDDAPQFIRHGDRGFVMSPPFL